MEFLAEYASFLAKTVTLVVATESALSRKVRRVLLDTHGLNEEFVKAVGYWRGSGH